MIALGFVGNGFFLMEAVTMPVSSWYHQCYNHIIITHRSNGNGMSSHFLHILRIGALLALGLFFGTVLSGCQKDDNKPIKIGILHSLTGTMAISEKPVVDATLLAIEEINAKGGLLGRKLVPIIADGASDDATFAAEAQRLITVEKVAVVFGCWTSASRKSVKPIFEKYHSLLFYPVQYEGLEQSPNIIYTGATPNQQIIPAISWAAQHLGKRLYLIGSDYVYPHIANRIITMQASMLGLTIVGESYLPLGSTHVNSVINKIKASGADVVINTINGDSNISFFHAFTQAGLTAATMPVMSFSLGESELAAMANSSDMSGHFAAWSYFQSIKSPQNRQFIQALRSRYGQDIPISDPMEAAYFGVHLWAQTVHANASTDISAMLTALEVQTIDAPEGIVAIDLDSHHTWRPMRIGQITAQQGFDIVWSSAHAIHPEPYPFHIRPSDARIMLQQLFDSWGHAWTAPVRQPMP